MLAEFNEVISDFGGVINRLNSQFGTDFTPFENSLDNRNKTFNLIEKMGREHFGKNNLTEYVVGRPSIDRNILKSTLKYRLEQISLKENIAKANDYLYRTCQSIIL
ncbi:MAG: hypothetical protein HC804_02965 [Anaerolineae bacterium]|nr:hypothetical protein [Anaerolineae bacterium]